MIEQQDPQEEQRQQPFTFNWLIFFRSCYLRMQ